MIGDVAGEGQLLEEYSGSQADKQVAVEVENEDTVCKDFVYFDGFEIILVRFVLITSIE